jgi:glycyl-tRNA synthetase
MQEALQRLAGYWNTHGCVTTQPMNTEVGAGTLNPATFLRVLGPEPWRVAYVEPSVRPDDSRYGENPNRIQCHTQFQVIMKPEPGNPQELYLGSLETLGIDVRAHDVRFVEDNWASPALGAWGLGWEVWLDGLEISQFTYFQQAGGVNLDPISVELTYGMERIIMALQGARHFKDIEYAPGISYGELFGEAEYELSRYYLDDADVAANRQILELSAAEAQRMLDLKLPIPAHVQLLRCSHAFNVLDARGAVSTSERAAEFARMRHLAADTATLWMAKRHELGHPLGVTARPQAVERPTAAVVDGDLGETPRQLVFEIGTEELPPSEIRSATRQLATFLGDRLDATRLRHGQVRVMATPRRLVAIVDEVAIREDDHTQTVRGPRVAVAFGASGQPSPAALGFARSRGVSVDDLEQASIDGVPHLVLTALQRGRSVLEVLAPILGEAVSSLRGAKNMRWEDPTLSFARPVRWLLALWGDQVVAVQVSALAAGRTTRVHRTAGHPTIEVASAEEYETVLDRSGIRLDRQARRQLIVADAGKLAETVGGRLDVEGETALIEQIVDLVEEPRCLIGAFEPRYLELPEAVLTTVMRKHQRYLPVRDSDGRLLPYFVTAANGTIDENLVRQGNEGVLRARYEDALFFFRADQKVSPEELRERLSRLSFTDRLGSMRDRAERVTNLADVLAEAVELPDSDRQTLDAARKIAKFDLSSQMVTELTSLAGVMAREYAMLAGAPRPVADALFEMVLPRQAGDNLPTGLAGAILSLADRCDFLVGLAATVGLPTGSSDPFALRRAALAVLAVSASQPALAPVTLRLAFAAAAKLQPVPVPDAVLEEVFEFVSRRLEQQLIEDGVPVDRIRAVLLHADRPARVNAFLADLDGLLGDETFRQLAAALQRARRIAPDDTTGDYEPAVLTEPAEVRLHEVAGRVRAQLNPTTMGLADFVRAAEPLVGPVNEFFDEVFVMVDDAPLRQTRLGLLASVRDLGAAFLRWEQLRP